MQTDCCKHGGCTQDAIASTCVVLFPYKEGEFLRKIKSAFNIQYSTKCTDSSSNPGQVAFKHSAFKDNYSGI